MECGVCLALPEGEVHQCNEGHCYCVDCWNQLDPRRCPECRLPLPQVNRNRAAERAIAALEACCDHGGEATTMCICKSISNSKGVIFRLRAAGRTAEIV